MEADSSNLLNEQQRALLLRRARESAAAALGGPPLDPDQPQDPILLRPAGCFTTFKRKDIEDAGLNLRGCLGNMEAQEPLWTAVENLAGETVTKDPRFRQNPVTLDELRLIQIDISILHPKRKMADPLAIELGVDGIEVEGRGPYSGRRGIFLPQVATEFNLSKEQFLSACCQSKAGIPAEAWRNPEQCEVFAFRAEVFGEA